MEAKWLIQKYSDDLFFSNIKKSLEKNKLEYKIIDDIFFYNKSFDFFDDNDCVTVIGSLNFCRYIQKNKRWVPGAICNFNNFKCSTYYSYFGKYLLNSDYIMMPILEIERNKDYIFNNFGIDNKIFIRPNSGAKPITGQIIDKYNLEKELNIFSQKAGNDLDKIIVVISTPKNIDKEWRFVVSDKKVITGSQYIEYGEINIKKHYDPKAKELAEKIAFEKWEPDRAYTIDICKANFGEYYLLEINSFSSSCLYLCDLDVIIPEVSKVATKEYEEYNLI